MTTEEDLVPGTLIRSGSSRKTLPSGEEGPTQEGRWCGTCHASSARSTQLEHLGTKHSVPGLTLHGAVIHIRSTDPSNAALVNSTAQVCFLNSCFIHTALFFPRGACACVCMCVFEQNQGRNLVFICEMLSPSDPSQIPSALINHLSTVFVIRQI